MTTKTTTKTSKDAPKVTRRKLADYVQDDRNANMGNERGLQLIEQSLNKLGAGRSLVADKHGKLPAGNKTYEAAALAGIEDVIEIETDGKALIVHKRTDWDLDDPKGAAREYAYFDNRASEVGLTWDANQIAADVAAGVDLSGMWTADELDYVIHQPQIDAPSGEGDLGEDNSSELSEGELLSLVNITIADPTFKVTAGDVYKLGNHFLICVNVITQWIAYISYLKGENTLFCPYPGPFVPLTMNADKYTLVMVQPDPYIAGHIIDRWIEQKGKTSVKRI